MKKYFFIFILFSLPTIIFGQFIDDFSDGNFTNNPNWTGDTDKFEVDSMKFLHHKTDSISGESYLYTESNVSINAVWEFDVELLFDPSPSNFAKVYLISDEQDLTNDLNGFYVKIGGQVGTWDEVSLYAQTGNTHIKIIDGIDGVAASNPNLKVKVTRDVDGWWELIVGTPNFPSSQGTFLLNMINNSANYFGVYCKYTSTRSNLFFFDNFVISGDSMIEPTQTTFKNDIIINEIFADPNPSIGLPIYEYIELFNTTDSAIYLTDWTVTIGSTEKVFPPSIIEPDSFVILIKDAVTDSFPSNISKIGFSSIALTNSGTNITLKNNADSIINTVNFTNNWYNDTDKDDGGWSLELINPNVLCLNKENWSASNDVSGGTPGERNSIFSNLNSIDSLYITEVFSSEYHNVTIKLSRGLDSNQLLNTSNYFVNPIGFPTAISLSNNNTNILLTYTDSLLAGINYTLQIQNILADCLGNSIDTTLQHNFTPPFNATINEVVINEIFIDESPSIGLPKTEYIELYNNTNKRFSLTDWILTIGTSERQFPASFIEPDSFVILIKENSIDSFSSSISTIGFSSISLANGGADVILKDNNGKLINAISYTDKWYNNDNKSEGGWSIEQVNPNFFCEGKNNWRASIANIGGTPGKQNSVLEQTVFSEEFRITKAFIIDSNTVQIHFNKTLDSLTLLNISVFEINGISTIINNPITPFFNAVNLTFNFNFSANTTYTILANGLMDCSGNLLSNSMEFGIPDSTLVNDIIINEILFNPKDDGVDYVEIYNNSNSFFDLSKLRIANFFELGGVLRPEHSKIITDETLLFAPQTYLVLTTDSSKVKAQYNCENSYNFIEVESMPTLSNEEGTICIVHQSLNQIIDAFAYHEDMHFSLLETEDGVSLERLAINTETQNTSNWHSAASTVGFGTPTYKNSQEYISQSIGEINIDPKLFSPNNDGYKDVCSINWSFSKTNLMATIKVFDNEGRLVKNPMNNQMIGNKGSTIWDGTSKNGLQLNTGMYIVWMEVFSEDGTTERFKKVVVLSR